MRAVPAKYEREFFQRYRCRDVLADVQTTPAVHQAREQLQAVQRGLKHERGASHG